ncbi:hypothetical protein OCU04_005901, partial [Sclerotinia nivalis]
KYTNHLSSSLYFHQYNTFFWNFMHNTLGNREISEASPRKSSKLNLLHLLSETLSGSSKESFHFQNNQQYLYRLWRQISRTSKAHTSRTKARAFVGLLSPKWVAELNDRYSGTLGFTYQLQKVAIILVNSSLLLAVWFFLLFQPNQYHSF